MEKVSRFSFIRQMAGEALKVLPVMFNVPLPESSSPAEPEPTWIPIGYLEDWPPGKIAEVNQGRQVVLSTPAGLLALDKVTYQAGQSHPRRPLRLEVTGQLAIRPHGEWPQNSLLSALTGNQIRNQEDPIII